MSEPSTNPVRQALRAMTHGVYVLSVRHAEHDHYVVISLAMQCSVEPARIAFAISTNARILPALRAAFGGVFSILGANESAAVRRYGAPGRVRNAPSDVFRTHAGHPVPPECAYWVEFEVEHEGVVGDHVLVVANVTHAGAHGEKLMSVGDNSASAFSPMTLAGSRFPYGG